MNEYSIDKNQIQVFHMNHIDRDTYTFNVVDNNCPDIVVGDGIIIEGVTYVIESLEWFYLLMDDMEGNKQKGDSVTVLLEGV